MGMSIIIRRLVQVKRAQEVTYKTKKGLDAAASSQRDDIYSRWGVCKSDKNQVLADDIKVSYTKEEQMRLIRSPMMWLQLMNLHMRTGMTQSSEAISAWEHH